MAGYLVKRILTMVPLLILISFITFVIIQLPPGDFLTTYMQTLATAAGGTITPELQQQIEGLRLSYGLDQPIYVQYWRWVSAIVTEGNFGYSFTAQRPVSDFVWTMMDDTMILLVGAFVFIFSVALPIGFYSAVRQYSLSDYLFTFLGFLGLAIPNFLLALLLLYAVYSRFGVLLSGMYSSGMIDAAWSWAKFVDLLKHIWLPVVVIGTAGTAAVIRVLRNNLLDELQKPYVMTARAKGVPEWRLLLKYPMRIAINPLLSSIGFILPDLFSATIITSVVLNLPTVGPMYLTSLLNQDMYLAGAIVMLLATVTVVGTIVSDVLLALADPRIRYDE